MLHSGPLFSVAIFGGPECLRAVGLTPSITCRRTHKTGDEAAGYTSSTGRRLQCWPEACAKKPTLIAKRDGKPAWIAAASDGLGHTCVRYSDASVLLRDEA